MQLRPEVYIAAPFNDRDLAKLLRSKMAQVGIDCTSSWIDLHHTNDAVDDATKQKEAHQDLFDIHRARYFVLLPGQSVSGGKWVELGYAYGRGKRIIVHKDAVQGIFCNLDGITIAPSIFEIIDIILAEGR